ncbi:glucan biosynthesis protein [Paenibacillus sp. CFBP13512]|uniref:SMI1/KNR4 family protein n=1 Tax=Paenibacillus sp. CFBP13512 TaxID=2184007 RepID=UPI0010BFABD5|nr:SMI1/KNR4 family protein [Paenibacillus sp. CFBP13512]TKJ90653.1 glucan biosynthesis protein [Paenibacillus sp. CFBP13512]
MLQQNLVEWQQQWKQLLHQLELKGADTALLWEEPATDQEIADIEHQLTITLPEELRSLLQDGGKRVMVYWNISYAQTAPFELSGDTGWDIESIDFSDFGDDEQIDQKRYLCFYHAGNGDELVLDLYSNPQRPMVFHWAHETGEFHILAVSLTDFLNKVTELSCIGAEEWQYQPFIDNCGLNLYSKPAKQWQQWIHDYLHFTLEDASQDLNQLIRYTELNGIEDDTVQAFAHYHPDEVLQAWLERIQIEHTQSIKDGLIEYTGLINRHHAADWVRKLWDLPEDQRINSYILAYLTAICLPEDEGLERIWRKIEEKEKEKERKLNGYEANTGLKNFHSRKVIHWIKDRVTFPYDGWDQLFAVSNPQSEDYIEWLQGNDAQRQIAISALGKSVQLDQTFHRVEQVESVRVLLEQAMNKAVIKKEKRIIAEALKVLDQYNVQ